MIRFLVKTLNIITWILLFLTGIAVFLLATTPGLRTMIQLSHIYLPGTIKIQNLEGSALSNFKLGELKFHTKTFKVTIKQLEVQWKPHRLRESQLVTAQWHDLHLEIANNKLLDSENGTIIATGILPDMEIDLDAQITTKPKDNWLMNTKIRGTLPWQWKFTANLSQSQNEASKQAGLYTNLSAQGEITATNQGKIQVNISPGFYHVPNNDALPVIPFKSGALNMTLTPKQLKGSGFLVIDPNKNLKFEFQMPQFTLDKGLNDSQTINSDLSLEVNSLDFLQKLSPEISKLKGHLIALFRMNGTLGKSQLMSQLILKQTSFSIPTLGLNLDSVEIKIVGKEKSWEATGSIYSSGHQLFLKGRGALSSQYTGDLTLEGTHFPLVNTSEYQIYVSPNLNLHFNPTAQILSGTILVPYAKIKPRSFHNSISLPEDVVFKQNTTSPSPFSFISSMDVGIEMGKDVVIQAKGLKSHLQGTIQAKQVPQGSINAYGELSVRKGSYKAYGQDLKIQQGQLIFTGGPITNPGINMRAAKKINATPTTFSSSNQLLDFNSSNMQNINFGETMTLGVEVTGRLTHPKIQLFSDPAILSQADILSMLVLGRPASQANKAGGQLLLAAISSMNLGSNTSSLQLLEQLKQSTGIDFNVQTNTNYNQITNTINDTTAVVVGKSLSKRLYLSYNIGLSQTETNMLTLRYILNKFFSIQVSNSDTSNAIDFLYTSNKKNKSLRSRH